MTRWEYRKSINSSGFLFNFWLIQFICYTTLFFTTVNQDVEGTSTINKNDWFRLILLYATFGLSTVLFILEFFADNKCQTRKSLLGNDIKNEESLLIYTSKISDGPRDSQIEEALRSSRNFDETTSEHARLIVNYEPDKRPCPELLSSFILRITYAWLNRFYN